MKTVSATTVLAGLLLAAPSLAFRGTSPLLLWASDPTAAFEGASSLLSSSGLVSAEEVYGKLDTLGCDWQSVVVVHSDELHHSHLPSLKYPIHDAHLHIPYLSKPHRASLDSRIDLWADKCGASVVDGFEARGKDEGKQVIKVEMGQDEVVLALPSDLAAPYILVLTGSPSRTPSKRQEVPFPTTTSAIATATATDSASATATATSTSRPSTIPTKGPLLDRVQILTTPIITALLVTFGLFIPIAAFGVYALVGIQVPPRMMEIGKGLVVSKDRKEQ